MIPSPFDYVAASSVDEAVQALAQAGEDVKVLAGGQSLVPVLRLRLATPTTLVDLNKISELRGVRDDGDAIVVGAMTTHHDVINNMRRCWCWPPRRWVIRRSGTAAPLAVP
jgi:aerobic carbon-monoxide dehydrogenase medium subunit